MGDKTITEALGLIDPAEDYQWTSEGLPRMDVIERMVGDRAITRKEVTDADPEFCREVAIQRRASAPREESDNGPDSEVQEQGRQEKAQGEIDPEEAVRDALLAVSTEIEALTAERAEIDKAIDQQMLQQQKLQHLSQSQHSATADMKARIAFVHSQNDQRAKRFERGRKIMAVIGKHGLNPLSRLDQAMRRKTARGTRRPPPRTPRHE